jgi:NTE family protein
VVVATDVTSRPQASTVNGVPTTLDLADSLLHLATGDRLLEDLRTLTTVNTLLAGGAKPVTTREGRAYRRVPALVVAPEGPDDIGGLVTAALTAGPGALLAPLAGLLTAVTGVPGKSTPDLISFLLFLSSFTRRAVDLGEKRAAQVLGRRGGGWSEAPPGLAGIR